MEAEVVEEMILSIHRHHTQDIQARSLHLDSKDGHLVSGAVLWVVLRRDIWQIEATGNKKDEVCLEVVATGTVMGADTVQVVHGAQAVPAQADQDPGAVQGQGTRVLDLDLPLGDRIANLTAS